jgi:SEL1 protein
MYAEGLGVAADNATALAYFRDGAAKGAAASVNGLGVMYLHGKGIAQDLNLALKHFKTAADAGHSEAQFNLGNMYFKGLGVERSYQTALQYYTMAGHQGHTRAMFAMGQMHHQGFGTYASCSSAVKLFKTTAELGAWSSGLGEAFRLQRHGNNEGSLIKYLALAEMVRGCTCGQAWRRGLTAVRRGRVTSLPRQTPRGCWTRHSTDTCTSRWTST